MSEKVCKILQSGVADSNGNDIG